MLSIGDVIPTQKIALDRQTLCQPREEGVLGNWKTKIMNEATIVKQVWRIAQNPNTLVARTFKGKYFPMLDIFFFFYMEVFSFCIMGMEKHSQIQRIRGRSSTMEDRE